MGNRAEKSTPNSGGSTLKDTDDSPSLLQPLDLKGLYCASCTSQASIFTFDLNTFDVTELEIEDAPEYAYDFVPFCRGVKKLGSESLLTASGYEETSVEDGEGTDVFCQKLNAYNIAEGRVTSVVQTVRDIAAYVAIHEDYFNGPRLAATVADRGTVSVWNMDTGKKASRLEARSSSRLFAGAMLCIPDWRGSLFAGTYSYSPKRNRKILYFDYVTEKPREPLLDSVVEHMHFFRDGLEADAPRGILFASSPTSVSLWDPQRTNDCIGRIPLTAGRYAHTTAHCSTDRCRLMVSTVDRGSRGPRSPTAQVFDVRNTARYLRQFELPTTGFGDSSLIRVGRDEFISFSNQYPNCSLFVWNDHGKLVRQARIAFEVGSSGFCTIGSPYDVDVQMRDSGVEIEADERLQFLFQHHPFDLSCEMGPLLLSAFRSLLVLLL